MPSHFASSGLLSNSSRWLGAPAWKRKITRFAFGAKCGAFGASGSAEAACAVPAAQDAAEQRMQRDRAETDAALLEEPAARVVALILVEEGLVEVLAVGHRWFLAPIQQTNAYCFVIVSSRLNSARAATV